MSLDRFKWLYMNFDGRIGRKKFWLFYVLPMMFVGYLMEVLLSDVKENYGVVTALFVLLLMIPILCGTLCGYIKRQHDLGHSGWWVALGIIPIIGIIYNFIYLGCLVGNEGVNKYGSPDVPVKGVTDAKINN